MTETAYQCKTCGEIFAEKGNAVDHAARHRDRPSQRHGVELPESPDPEEFVRSVDVRDVTSEVVTLHDVAGEPAPSDTETVYLVENDPADENTEDGDLTDYGVTDD